MRFLHESKLIIQFRHAGRLKDLQGQRDREGELALLRLPGA